MIILIDKKTCGVIGFAFGILLGSLITLTFSKKNSNAKKVKRKVEGDVKNKVIKKNNK